MTCVCDTSATLSGTCPGLCHEVAVMEFGLYHVGIDVGVGYIPRWFICLQAVAHLNSNYLIVTRLGVEPIAIISSACLPLLVYDTTNVWLLFNLPRLGGVA